MAATDDGVALMMLDLVSFTASEVTSAPIIAFFWSPDGSRLAAVTTPGDAQLQWLIIDGTRTWRLPTFGPTRAWVGAVLPFFEQYSQSHAVWSPDGKSLVAPAVNDTGRSGAVVHSVDATDETLWLDDADLAWWA